MQTMSTVIETQSLVIEVSVGHSLCIETIERVIMAGFPAKTHLLRWAIVGQNKPVTSNMVGYCIEATVQRTT
jgi:hypothetical protein